MWIFGFLVERTVSVEDASNPNINAILAVETVRQGFGYTFAFVVASARADRINVAPADNLLGRGCGLGALAH